MHLKDGEYPYIDDESATTASTVKKTASNVPTNPPPPTRFHHILQDPRYTSAKQDGAFHLTRKPSRIPKAIITGPRPDSRTSAQTYAKAASKYPSQFHGQTTISPDRSTTSTISSKREKELEEELSATSSQLKETQKKLKEAHQALKTTQEAQDKLKQLLKESVDNIQTQLQAQKDEMEESFNRKLAEQWQQFQSQFALQNTNPYTTPNPPRKRQDTRLSPYEIHGIPQYHHTQAPHYPMQPLYNPYQHYHMNPPPRYSAMDDYQSNSPFHYPGQTEQTEDTEWGKTTDQVQEPFQEDGSEEQI